VLEEVIDLARRAIVGDNIEALIIHVKDEVLALYFEARSVQPTPDEKNARDNAP
jgi:hypothetical protein